MNSKNFASQSGLDRKPYIDMCEDIDRRCRLRFEGLDFSKAARADDPMGLSNMFENEDRPPTQKPAEEPERGPLKEDLDAMCKGKGKGSKNNGKCNTCGGSGHSPESVHRHCRYPTLLPGL